jgi:catechol 2,3-dioxygenase-like lactoylglutathione lyase family enzyme
MSPSDAEGVPVTIQSVLINVADVRQAVDFYVTHLDARLIGEIDDRGAELDLVTGTIHLVPVARPAQSTWIADDLQAGFRHVGFKVADIDARVASLKAAGVPFHLEPIDAEGGVRIAFFYDPDGTLVEFVEGPLQYHEVFDHDAVEADWALGTPDRPRLDHVAETVEDLERSRETYATLGWTLMAVIHQPHDPRGFEIAYLRSGDLSLEVFSFAADLAHREPQLDAPGFVAVRMSGETLEGAHFIGTVQGYSVVADSDGLQRAVTA